MDLHIGKLVLVDVEIHQNRGVLPCDLLKTVQVMGPNHESLKKMTDNFDSYMESIPAYKIQGKCIFTTFSEGIVKIAYRAMYLDDNGFPMIPDMPLFIKALKLYIKQEVFGEKFEDGDISGDVYKKVEQDYCWAVSQLTSQMTLPDVAEMENMTNMLNQLVPSMHEYRKGFLHLGDHVNLPNKRF